VLRGQALQAGTKARILSHRLLPHDQGVAHLMGCKTSRLPPMYIEDLSADIRAAISLHRVEILDHKAPMQTNSLLPQSGKF
jgi:hypothetical protein